MRTFVVLPAYNEEKKLKIVLDRLVKCIPYEQIIIVDDASNDETFKIATNYNKKMCILRHDLNLGKGAAMKTGCEAALKLGADVIVTMDADDQHNPADIARLLEQIQKGNDIVFGSRIIGKNMPLTKFLGNKFLTIIINIFFKIFINDTQSGFKAFTAKTYNKIKWESRDYAVETEIIVKTAENKLKFSEIEIATIYHNDYKGTTPINGLQIFFKILKWKFI